MPASMQESRSQYRRMSVVDHAFNWIHVVCSCLDIVGVACLFCCFLFDRI